MTTAALLAAFDSGLAITADLADLFAADGIDITAGRHILTADEFAAVSALAATLPSTPGNNVWD